VKAISLWQPWASLWLSPAKIHETRSWPTKHRGWTLVHAAKRSPDDFQGQDELDEVCKRVLGADAPLGPRGALIGMVNIVDCQRTEAILNGYQEPDDFVCGDYRPGRYGWRRSDYVIFKKPIPYRGMQMLFSVPESVLPPEAKALIPQRELFTP